MSGTAPCAGWTSGPGSCRTARRGRGPAGPAGLSGREQLASETPLTAVGPKNLTVTCPVGKKVLGGGVEISGAGRNRVTVVENKPSGDNAWEGEAFEAVATSSTWKLVVHAICATVAP